MKIKDEKAFKEMVEHLLKAQEWSLRALEIPDEEIHTEKDIYDVIRTWLDEHAYYAELKKEETMG